MYCPFVKHMMEKLQVCLLQDQNQFKVQQLLPNKANQLIQASIREIYKEFQEDLPPEGER